MGWIALSILLVAVFVMASLSSYRTHLSRRSNRLETAFFRARGQRMTTNGIRSARF